MAIECALSRQLRGNWKVKFNRASSGKELYFRISGVCFRLPALRETKGGHQRADRALLPKTCRKLAGEHSHPDGRRDATCCDSYSWPGNIRELENLARNILVLGDAKSAIEELCIPTQTTSNIRNDDAELVIEQGGTCGFASGGTRANIEGAGEDALESKAGAQKNYKSVISRFYTRSSKLGWKEKLAQR